MLEKYSEKISQHKVLILLLAIVFFGGVLRIIWINPMHSRDETQHALEAMHIAKGVYDPNIIYYNQGVRYTLLLPLAFIFLLFGVSKITFVLFTYSIAIANIFLVYFIGKEFFDERIGLLSAFLLALFPLNIFYSTILEADIIISFYSGLAMYCYYLGLKQIKKVYIFIAGLIFGFAIFTKIFILFPLFSLNLYEIFILRDINESFKRGLFLLLGFILIASPFLFYQYKTTNDFLYNVHVESQGTGAITKFKDNPPPDMDPHNKSLNFNEGINRAKMYLSNIFLSTKDIEEKPKLNIYFIFFLFSVIYCLIKKINKAIFFILWALPSLFILMFYILYQQRYLLVLEIPIIILVAYFLLVLKEKTNIGFWFLLFLIILISFYQLGTTTIFNPKLVYKDTRIMHEEELIYLFLKDLPEKDIYITNYEKIPFLNLYFRFSKNYSGVYGFRGPTNTSFYDLHFVRNLSEIRDSYVVFYDFTKKNDDPFQYYAQNNGSLQYFREQKIPKNWYILTTIIDNASGNQIGAIMYVRDDPY